MWWMQNYSINNDVSTTTDLRAFSLIQNNNSWVWTCSWTRGFGAVMGSKMLKLLLLEGLEESLKLMILKLFMVYIKENFLMI